MHRRLMLPLVAFLIVACPQIALGQADAKDDIEAAKKAFKEQNYEKARDLFKRASQTDVKNPEVFVWLGRAHYQLGELDKAIAAWTKARALAPKQPYATKMLDALRAQLVEADTTIRLIEVMLRERLFKTALRRCYSLLQDKALTDAQRAKVLTLQAEAQLESNKAKDALATLREIGIRYADKADPAKTTLLLARAKMRTGGEGTAQGLALLKKVLADHAGTPAAASAEYELLRFRLREGPQTRAAEALQKWIAANAKHARAPEARRYLVDVYLAISRQAGRPAPDAGLSDADSAALATATALYKQIVRSGEANRLTQTLLNQLNVLYARNKAYGAAIAGAAALVKADLPRPSRLLVLRALAKHRADLAIEQLTRQAKAGKLPAGKMPKLLADAVAACEAINREFPAQAAWRDQAALAERVRSLASLVPTPAKVTGAKAPHRWAVQIALPVIKANTDTRASAQAVQTVLRIVDECAKLPGRPARGIAMGINTQLLSALPPERPEWAAVMLKQIDLQIAHAAGVFADNVKIGRDKDNAKLSESQKRLLATMAKLVGREATRAPTVLKKLASHLTAWLRHGHYAVVVEAYERLSRAMPEAQQRACELAVVRAWVHEVIREHNRLLAAGLSVPRKLDPTLAKALKRCRALQKGLEEEDPFLRQVRGVWDGILAHYTALEYFDVAEQAIGQGRGDPPVPLAEIYAQLTMANFQNRQARRELKTFLKQYNAAKKIALSPAFEKAVAAYKKFITDHPTSALAGQAAGSLIGIGRLFQGHKAYDVAVGIYRDFAAFAEKIDVLSQAAPGAASMRERGEFAAAGALYAKAADALRKAETARKAPTPPPAKISEQFTAAINAYKGFIKAYPDGALLGQAIRQIMSAGLQYAKINAWDVAEGIYADLLGAGLALHRPERIELARGLCHLGKVIPDHARKVLQALSVPVRPAPISGPARLSGITDLSGRIGGVAFEDSGLVHAYAERGGGGGGGGPGPTSAGRRARGARTNGKARARPEPKSASEFAPGDVLAMAAIRKDQQRRAALVARIRDKESFKRAPQPVGKSTKKLRRPPVPPAPVLSDAEIARREKAFDDAYKIFQAIRKTYPDSPTSDQARGEIMIMAGHWRTIRKWRRAARLTGRYLKDNAADTALPQLRLGIARDFLAWAGRPIDKKLSTQEMLAEVAGRYNEARELLAKIAKSFPDEKAIVHQAQWQIANSFLTQGRAVARFSATLARGQYVRAARELQQVAVRYHDHPNIAAIPQMLWNIAEELAGKGYYDEAVTVWNDLTIHYPTHSLARKAGYRIAQTYQVSLKRPLLAAEAYVELNFILGGSSINTQNAIFEIGLRLKGEKRWVEALHVLETFVDTFPRHARAGQALTMIGQIHQANEAWEKAIAAYRRVINEFAGGPWVRDAKWAIADCTINLSRWREAIEACRAYLKTYPKDKRIAEARRRIGVLKDLARYQALVDEQGQRKAFDAQYQIAEIVRTKLANPAKAIIEYRKVTANWPKSHLADDALFKVGTTYLTQGETKLARRALLEVAEKYPTSPLADDALYMVAQSYEQEAVALTTVTRGATIAKAQKRAQTLAYHRFADVRTQMEANTLARIRQYKDAGKGKLAEEEEARQAGRSGQFNIANVAAFAQRAAQEMETLTATQLADRQDKINAALRKAVTTYQKASEVAGADKADESLLRMARIYADKLKDTEAAMKTYLEIVRQFSGRAVAEDASWRIAQYHEKQGKFAEAIKAYEAFLRNYRRSPRAGNAQFAIAETYEHLGQWVKAMDAYTNYIENFPSGPLVAKAREQITWIKTYRL